jgi:hypothetical protein
MTAGVDVDQRLGVGVAAQDAARVDVGEFGEIEDLGAQLARQTVAVVGDVGGKAGPDAAVVMQRAGEGGEVQGHFARGGPQSGGDGR